MMIGELLLVSLELAIELVREGIDGRVHICVERIGEQVAAGYMNGCFSLLIEFFHAENNVCMSGIIEVSFESHEFGLNVIFEGLTDIHKMSAHVQLHRITPLR